MLSIANLTPMTRSIWQETASVPTRAPLKEHLTTDVCVVGAGIAGLSVAYQLARAGKRVVVVDRDQIASGETGRTTAHLANAIDDRYVALEKAVGARQRAARRREPHRGDRLHRATVRSESIDCDFKRLDGYLVCADGDTPRAARGGARGHAARGAHGRHAGDVDPGARLGERPRAALSGAGTLPRPALRRRTRARDRARGGRDLLRHPGGEDRRGLAGDGHARRTDCTVAADDVVVCTNGSISDMMVTHIKQAPYRTFVVAFRVPKGSVPDALYWDTGDPYHYVRIQPLDDASDVLIVGGEDHKTAHEDDAGERFDAAGAVDARALPDRRRARARSGRGRCSSRTTISPSSARTPTAPSTCGSRPATRGWG